MTEQGPETSACPLALDVLPTNLQKHVDPKAPVPLRMKGARALVPMGPRDSAGCDSARSLLATAYDFLFFSAEVIGSHSSTLLPSGSVAVCSCDF
jgi:hypothetical protein